jgi:vancomycin resistance protein YoaR
MAELAAKLVPRRLPRVSTLAVATLLLVAALPYARLAQYRGEALPGTSIAGVGVSGLDRRATAAAVETWVAPRLQTPVEVRTGRTTIAVRPAELFAVDALATADRALAVSRRSEPERFAALAGFRQADAAPVLRDRPTAIDYLLNRVRRESGRAASAAELSLDGLQPRVTPARDGLRLDARALVADLRRAALDATPVTARFAPVKPRYSTADAERAAELARGIVSKPVHLFLDRRPLRALAPIELARLVRFERRAGDFLVALDGTRLARVIDPALGAQKRRAVNARLEVVGDRVRVLPDRPGVGLDKDAALAGVTAAAYSPSRRMANVKVAVLPADVTAAELTSLGITEKISSFTTNMGVSSSNRIWNVQLMARYIDGTIVKPGEVFSFNRVVGERTAERGFREGQMIVGSLLLPSIGGGVCQTATTLFNNAFELGLPILERHNHSFYISHYPLGRDATVSWGGPDFEFKNDLRTGILIKSSYTDSTLTFTFYGAPSGRRVVATTSPQTRWREPRTSYAYDPYAPAGSIRSSAGSNQSGFDVTVNRTVYDGDRVLREDAFKSRYIPVGPTVVYGPGTNPPRIDFTLPPPE